MSQNSLPSLRAFRLPKHGGSEASCQDAFRIAPDLSAWRAAPLRQRKGAADGRPARARGRGRRQVWGGVGLRLRMAVADGASTTCCSGLWAQLLARAGVQYTVPWEDLGAFPERIKESRVAWAQGARTSLPANLPWYAEASLDLGAYATVVRVAVVGRNWEADGWGDSCLFHVRQGRPIQTLPPLTVADFAAAPCMLSSIPGRDGTLQGRQFMGSGVLEQGDALLLATDALSCWLIAQACFATAVEELMALDGEDAFAAWVADKRLHHSLKNDDTTLLIAEFV